ncbi:MAG: hypothetical protein J6S85_03875 [Methanobrevibacter sp.]|nr:hypothetical protein [Methanobrevibacter sp.]MBO7712681.1 hypothetical protein [Methanobrevibacter sp.]
MAGIPRFDAQVGQISVPRMRDYGYEQNVSIYKTLKAAGERIDNTFFEMVAEGKLGEPNQTTNPEFEAAAKEYSDAVNNNRPDAEINEKRLRFENTPATKFSWFSWYG